MYDYEPELNLWQRWLIVILYVPVIVLGLLVGIILIGYKVVRVLASSIRDKINQK